MLLYFLFLLKIFTITIYRILVELEVTALALGGSRGASDRIATDKVTVWSRGYNKVGFLYHKQLFLRCSDNVSGKGMDCCFNVFAYKRNINSVSCLYSKCIDCDEILASRVVRGFSQN